MDRTALAPLPPATRLKVESRKSKAISVFPFDFELSTFNLSERGTAVHVLQDCQGGR